MNIQALKIIKNSHLWIAFYTLFFSLIQRAEVQLDMNIPSRMSEIESLRSDIWHWTSRTSEIGHLISGHMSDLGHPRCSILSYTSEMGHLCPIVLLPFRTCIFSSIEREYFAFWFYIKRLRIKHCSNLFTFDIFHLARDCILIPSTNMHPI